MLVKLLPDQISRFWPYIKYALEQSDLDNIYSTRAKMNNVLESLLFDGMQNWLIINPENFDILGNVITPIYVDNSTKTKVLRVYNLFGFEDLSNEIWEDNFHTMIEFAKASGCERLDAFTDNEKVLKMAKLYSYNTRLTYITREI